MARLLIDERERGGYPIWVAGPALVHSRARADMVWFIRARIRGGATRRQRRRRPRHRGVDLRHDARHERHGTGAVGRPRPAHARDQQGPRGRLDRSGGAAEASSPNGIMHACVAARTCRSCSRDRFATMDHCPMSSPTPIAGAGRDEAAHDPGDDGDPDRHGAARDRDGQHAAGVRHGARRLAARADRRSASTRRSSS